MTYREESTGVFIRNAVTGAVLLLIPAGCFWLIGWDVCFFVMLGIVGVGILLSVFALLTTRAQPRFSDPSRWPSTKDLHDDLDSRADSQQNPRENPDKN
jgi:hypothetical protein